MANNQYYNKIMKGSTILVDLTSDTVAADKLAQGYTAHDASGAPVVGTMSGGGGGGYVYQDGDGYLVLGSESSGDYGYKLLGSTEYTVSTTNTSIVNVGTFTAVGAGQYLQSKGGFVYVKVRDKQGARAGYFYGTDTFQLGSSVIGYTYRCAANGTMQYTNSLYGVYRDSGVSGNNITIVSRYNSTFSLTVDSTYSVEVYSLDFPDGINPFD